MKYFLLLFIVFTSFSYCSGQSDKPDKKESNYGLKMPLNKYLVLYEDVLKIESEKWDVEEKMKIRFLMVKEFAGPNGVKIYKQVIYKALKENPQKLEEFKSKIKAIDGKYKK